MGIPTFFGDDLREVIIDHCTVCSDLFQDKRSMFLCQSPEAAARLIETWEDQCSKCDVEVRHYKGE